MRATRSNQELTSLDEQSARKNHSGTVSSFALLIGALWRVCKRWTTSIRNDRQAGINVKFGSYCNTNTIWNLSIWQ